MNNSGNNKEQKKDLDLAVSESWVEEDILLDGVDADQIEEKANEDIRKLQTEMRGSESFYTEDGLKMFLYEASEYRILTKEETTALLRRFADTGDPEAFQELVNHNLRLVYGIAIKYTNRGVDILDLIQEGNLGLMKAISKFDVERETMLSTYAVYWIKTSITRAINKYGRMIHIPESEEQTLFKIKRFIKNFEQDNGYTPEPEEISEFLNIDVSRVKNLITAGQPVESLDFTEDDDPERGNKYRAVVADDVSCPVSEFERACLDELLKKTASILSPEEAFVFSHFYTVNAHDKMSIPELADALGLKSNQIRTLKAKAIKKIRGSSLAPALAEFLADRT